MTHQGIEKKEDEMGFWEKITLTRRRQVFFYDLVFVVFLLAAALLYHSIPELYRGFRIEIGPHGSPNVYVFEKYRLFLNAMWLGALGGVVISLNDVYDNDCDPSWSNCYNLWHIGRPFSGAVTGLIVALIFTAISSPPPSRIVVYMIAFILGTQEARFFTFLSELARIFVQVPPNLPSQFRPPAFRISSVLPSEGKAGSWVMVSGQGFEPGATVKLGPMKLDGPQISPDGVAAAGTLPKLGLAKDTKLDVMIVNPAGASVVALEKFKYLGD